MPPGEGRNGTTETGQRTKRLCLASKHNDLERLGSAMSQCHGGFCSIVVNKVVKYHVYTDTDRSKETDGQRNNGKKERNIK